jgi:DNA modification methylase
MPDKVSNWPASNPERRKISDLKRNPRNARIHPPDQIQMVAASIREFGWTMPVLVDEDNLMLAGHARVAAAEILGIQEVPVILALGWSDTQKQAYVEADNRLSELGQWDSEMRKEELQALVDADFPMDALGWGDSELAEFLDTGEIGGAADPDDIPALPKKPIVKAGDVWQMGAHRIICGDATEILTWQKLFLGERARAAMVFTDPPYGVSYEGTGFQVIEGDHKRRDDLYKLLVGSFRIMAKWTNKDAAFYIWHASATRTDFSQAMTAAGLVERQYLIWAKPSISLGHADYNWTHEPCFYASHQTKAPKFYGERSESTVWRVKVSGRQETATVIGPGVLLLDGNGRQLYVQQRIPKSRKVREVRIDEGNSVVLMEESGTGDVWEVNRDRAYEHPTQKPVELATRAIANSSQRDEIVVDGFVGSGTSVIAAEITGRRCFCIEIDPIYAEVVIERWMKFTSRAATLEGVPFNEIAKQRRRKRTERVGQDVGEAVPPTGTGVG